MEGYDPVFIIICLVVFTGGGILLGLILPHGPAMVLNVDDTIDWSPKQWALALGFFQLMSSGFIRLVERSWGIHVFATVPFVLAAWITLYITRKTKRR